MDPAVFSVSLSLTTVHPSPLGCSGRPEKKIKGIQAKINLFQPCYGRIPIMFIRGQKRLSKVTGNLALTIHLVSFGLQQVFDKLHVLYNV